MDLRLMGAIAVAFGLSLGSASPTGAQSVQLERSGDTYHRPFARMWCGPDLPAVSPMS